MPLPEFKPAAGEFFASRAKKPYTALCGSNNSGKSLLLKNLKRMAGRAGYLVGPQRFYHVYHIGTQSRDPNEYDNFENQFIQNFNNEMHNHENNFIDLGRIITGLSDAKRTKLFELCSALIGNQFSMKKVDEENELSMRYIDMDGQNLSVGSTGTRLLMTMLGLCMDERFHSMFIDEPELGLGPKIQASVAEFLADKAERDRYFPHLYSVFVATHSHLFLDKRNIGNNFVVRKEGTEIAIDKVDTFQKLHNLQFNLLGNSLEALFLPSAFVLVEGKTDQAYLDRWIQNRFRDKRVLVIQTQGDAKKKLHSLREAHGDLFKSPFRSRIFVVLDSVYPRGEPAALEDMGVLRENIVIWGANGIEFVYPPEVMAAIFGCSPEQIASMKIDGDEIAINGVQRKKNDLCSEVLSLMTAETPAPPELEAKFLTPLGRAVS